MNGSYSDETEAMNLKISLNATCDLDCQVKGSQWSVIYACAAFTLGLIGLNAILTVFGAWNYTMRMTSIFCHNFLTIVNIASVIITYRFRYREQGQLAALSTMHSRTISDTQYDLYWTY